MIAELSGHTVLNCTVKYKSANVILRLLQYVLKVIEKHTHLTLGKTG